MNTSTDTTITFFIYARKSTDDADRQIRSIEDQLAEARDLAKRHSLQVIDVLVEKQSAKSPGRPVFNEMIERIGKGEASGIIAWHPDRLARNMLDGGRIIHLVDTGVIRDLKFPTVQFEPTSQGKLNLAMLFGMSKYYVDALSENIRRGQRQKLRNGIWPKVAPVGYLNDRQAKVIFPDPERGRLVRKAFELFATGTFTIDRLKHALNDLGLTNRKGNLLSRAQYHRMLQNPLYCGIIRYNDELFEAKHKPLITKKLFDQVQDVMSEKSKPKTSTLKPYIYRGMFRCGECGCFITAETQKGANYLRCTKRVKSCFQPYVREDAISNELRDALRLTALPADWADCMIAELQNEWNEDKHSAKELAAGVQRDIEELDRKLERLMNAYLESTVTLTEYRQAKNKVIEEKKLLTEKKAVLENGTGSWFEPAIRFLKAAKSRDILATEGKLVSCRDEMKKTGSNLQILDRRLRWDPRGPWKILVDYGRLAQPDDAPAHAGAPSVGENGENLQMRRRSDTGRTH